MMFYSQDLVGMIEFCKRTLSFNRGPSVSNHPETVHQDEETDTANKGDDNGSETDTANEGDGNDSEMDTANEGEGEEVTSLAYFSSPKEKENDQIDRSTASETQSGISVSRLGETQKMGYTVRHHFRKKVRIPNLLVRMIAPALLKLALKRNPAP